MGALIKTRLFGVSACRGRDGANEDAASGRRDAGVGWGGGAGLEEVRALIETYDRGIRVPGPLIFLRCPGSLPFYYLE